VIPPIWAAQDGFDGHPDRPLLSRSRGALGARDFEIGPRRAISLEIDPVAPVEQDCYQRRNPRA
jgi:hypothetical protein